MFTQSLRRAIRLADAWAAPHGVDRYVEQFVPTWSSSEVRGRIVAVDRSASGSVVLTIKPNGNWTGFAAGQYTQLSVEIDGVRHTRCYSMASAATSAGTFQLGIKAHPHGLVSQHLVAHAAVGQVVGLTPAAGDFHLPAERPEHLLLVSGGSGVTPVLSMLRTLCAEGHGGPITFLHYAMSRDEQLFAAELDRIAEAHDNVTVVLRYGAQYLDESHLDAADPDWRHADTYVCGPAALMAAVEALATPERFHMEAFTLAQFAGEAGSAAGTLRFDASDRSVDNDGRTILEQAEAAGLAPESGCRMGICHTCTRSLTCGTVRDVVSGDVTTADPTTGTGVDIRVCVSAPVESVAIDL